MKRTVTIIALILSALFLFPSFGLTQRAIKLKKKRLALVSGNGAYKSAVLRNPVNDAYDMAQTLRNLRFEVIYQKNAGRREMEGVIRDFGKRLRKGGVGLPLPPRRKTLVLPPAQHLRPGVCRAFPKRWMIWS